MTRMLLLTHLLLLCCAKLSAQALPPEGVLPKLEDFDKTGLIAPSIPFLMSQTTSYHLPEGWGPESLPAENLLYDNGVGTFSIASKVLGQNVEIVTTFHLKPCFFPASDCSDLHTFLAAALSKEQQLLVLKKLK